MTKIRDYEDVATEGGFWPTLISHLSNLLEVFLQYLKCAQLLLLILDDWLWGDHLLRHARCDQHKVLLADLHPALFGVELADASTVTRLLQDELIRLIFGEFDNIQPSHCRSILTMLLDHLRGRVEQSLKALDQDRTQRTCAQVAGDTLMALEDSVIFSDQMDDRGHTIIGGDEGEVFGALAREVVDL